MIFKTFSFVSLCLVLIFGYVLLVQQGGRQLVGAQSQSPLPVMMVETDTGESTPLIHIGDGKLYFINFFASWCTPCLAEHPYLFELVKETEIPIIGIVAGDTPARIATYLEKHGNPYQAVYYVQMPQLNAFGVVGLPETYLVDGRSQTILYRHQGMIRFPDIAEYFKPAILSAR